MPDEAAERPLESPPPRAKRKYSRRHARARPSKPVAIKEFPGLNVFNCCDTCGPRCIITEAGSGTCAHPAKGALQSADANIPSVFAKWQRAKAELQKQQIDQKLRKAI
jgi:hypothetical protein